jgi:3-oxoacyl-(acyl-carrier-protein) synthase
MRPRVGVFGWGIVAPKSPNIQAFEHNLACSESWLSPFNGFGPDNFLVGTPEFRFDDYREWIDKRFPPRHFQNLKEKMDTPSLYAIGAFVQALQQNPGLEEELTALGTQAHVYIGTGLGSLSTIQDVSIKLYKSQKRWDRFWATRALAEHGTSLTPRNEDEEESFYHDWATRSSDLKRYLDELAEIDSLTLEGEVESGKLSAIREKEKRRTKLREKWQSPEPPWHVSANLIWNIHNVPAAQVSILGKISGLAFAPVAACSTFGVSLKLAMNAIQCGEAKVVVVGATDPPPHPLTVGAFYSARVISADRTVSTPLTRLQGTHVAGGSIVWIVGDMEYLCNKGFKPMGMEPLAVGVSSDAHHIITPSMDGPKVAIRQALERAEAEAGDLGTWDLHATATPGDFAEISTFRSIFGDSVLITARKGTFGHGMSAGGGWELTAQYLGQQQGKLFPTPISESQLNPAIAKVHDKIVFDVHCEFPEQMGGKLSMGIGGINACVISRPF